MRIALLTIFLVLTAFLPFTAVAQHDDVQVFLRMGSDGLPGTEVATRIPHSQTWLRLQGSYFDLSINDFATDFNDRLSFELLLDGGATLHHLALWADWPLNKKQWIRACVGVGLFAQSELSGKIQLAGTFRFNDIDFTPEEIGYWQGTVRYPIPFAPYVGMALGKIKSDRRIGISVDIGSYYRLNHRVLVDATNLLRGNEERADRLTELTKFLRWTPVLSLRMTYKLFNHQITSS